MVTQNMLCTREVKYVFGEKKIKFVTAFDIIKCRMRSNNRDCSLHAHLFSELPSNISTMVCLNKKIRTGSIVMKGGVPNIKGCKLCEP